MSFVVLFVVCFFSFIVGMQQEAQVTMQSLLQMSDERLQALPFTTQQCLRTELEHQYFLRLATIQPTILKATTTCPLIRVSPNGKIALIADEQKLLLLYGTRGRELNYGASLAAFSSDSRFCLCAYHNNLYLLDLSCFAAEYIMGEPGELLAKLSPEKIPWSRERPRSIALNNGTTALIGTDSFNAYILSLRSKKISTLAASSASYGTRDINTVALLGSYALMGSVDGSAYLWHSGAYLFFTSNFLHGHRSSLKTVGFNASGTRCLTHSAVRVRIWNLTHLLGGSYQ